MNRPAGYVIPPHVHNPVAREVHLHEGSALHQSRKVAGRLLRRRPEYLESLVLEPGDVILLAFGGHGFEMLEPTEIIEVKQGPYAGDQDKTRFDAVAPDSLRIDGPMQHMIPVNEPLLDGNEEKYLVECIRYRLDFL